jgi:hypothetical protein
MLSKNINIKIQRTTILDLVLYGCETWSLILREGHRLKTLENKMLRTIFGPKGNEVKGEDYITRSFIICTPH